MGCCLYEGHFKQFDMGCGYMRNTLSSSIRDAVGRRINKIGWGHCYT